ncbi:hypothetical protein CFP56_042020 [Quercus suber]
MHSKCSI